MIETIFRVLVILVIVTVALTFLSSLSVTFSFPFQYGDLLNSFLSIVYYILPFNKLMPIFVFVISITIFKISISLIKTIWDIFPMKG